MSKVKITYIVSRVDKVHEFEWVAEYLDRSEFEVSFIILGAKTNTELKLKLDELNVVNREIYFDTKMDLIRAWRLTKNTLKKWNPDIVHCHLIDATLIGLAAAKWLGIKNRIYTRHHSTFHHVFARHGIKYDLWANRNSKHIVAVSGMVKRIMVEMEKVSPNKISVIEHGFPGSTYGDVSQEEVDAIKNKYDLVDAYPVIGVVSRYDEWKGVNYIIDAFSKIYKEYPKARLVLANARRGDDVEAISKKLKTLPPESYVEIEFEKNNLALFRAMDMFVHVPIDSTSEAFGLVYVECMGQKIPIVATKSGVGEHILQHLQNGYVANYRDSESIYEGVKYVMSHPDETQLWTERGYQLVSNTFTIGKKIEQLEELYINLSLPDRIKNFQIDIAVKRSEDSTLLGTQLGKSQSDEVHLSEPLVSVIIPCYNRAHLLKQTVQTFMEQSRMDFELIIVDDGSTDDTKQVVDSFKSNLIKYFHIPNVERGAARNYGAMRASGKYLNFFDSDDLALPEHIEKATEIVLNYKGIKAFQLHVANRFGDSIAKIFAPGSSTINAMILRGEYCFPNGMFIEKNTFLKYKYNGSRKLAGTEDLELYLRMIPKIDILFFPIVTSVYLNHEGRSVLQFDEMKLVDRLDELILGIEASEDFVQMYRGKIKLVKSRMLSYIALHAALDGNKRISFKYYKKAVFTRPIEIFSRRSMAILKKILF